MKGTHLMFAAMGIEVAVNMTGASHVVAAHLLAITVFAIGFVMWHKSNYRD